MPVADIVVEYVNQPRGNSKKGSVKASDGNYYGVWPDKLAQYAKGGKYRVEYEAEEYQGKTYRTITKILQSATPASGGSLGQTRTSGGGMTPEQMFVTGVIGRCFEGTGGLPDEVSLTTYIIALRGAWQNGFAAKLGPTTPVAPEGELNDAIPF